MYTIDIETRSDKDISKCGVYAYTDTPYFDILLFAYSIDGQPVQVVDTANGEEIRFGTVLSGYHTKASYAEVNAELSPMMDLQQHPTILFGLMEE